MKPRIVDHLGRPIRAAAFEGASNSRRLAGWRAQRIGPNSAMFDSLETLRDRSRDADRQNPYATAIVDSLCANEIGTGIRPVFQHPDESVNERLTKRFEKWAKYADWDQSLDFWGLQALARETQIVSGECLARLLVDETVPFGSNPLRLELLEPDHLPLMQFSGVKDLPGGHYVRYGIEYDARGRRVAYYLHREHPSETVFGGSQELVRVPEAEIIHLMTPRRPKQRRGIPKMSPVLIRLWLLDQYDDAELVRKNLTAKLTGFITSPVADDGSRPLGGEDRDGSPGVTDDDMEPGTFKELDPGEDVRLADVDDVGGGYSSFTDTQQRAIAVGSGLANFQVSGNLGDFNFSSMRGGLNEQRRKSEQNQWRFIHTFCDRIMREWLRFEALVGGIDRADYLTNQDAYEDVRWVTPGWASVDPLKDALATEKNLEMGITSRAAAIAETGEDHRRIDKENERDLETKRKLGYGPNAAGSGDSFARDVAMVPDEQPARQRKEVLQ